MKVYVTLRSTGTEFSLSDQNIGVSENILNYESDQSYEGDQSMLISEGDQSSLISGFNEDISEDILEKLEHEVNYPNEAYVNLMTLVTKYKLSNATSNAIIK